MLLRPSMLAQADHPLVAFFHAQRTGGSAFKQLLRKQFGNDRVYAEQTVPGYRHWPHLSESDLEAFDVFAGHSDFKKNILKKRPLLLVTLLRDPVYRAASLHDYCKNKQGHALQALAQDTSLLEFYQRGKKIKPVYFLNLQCRRVCGKPSAKLAIDTIERSYFAVGQTDALHRFSSEWVRLFGWRGEPLAEKPTDPERYGERITDDFEALVIKDNAEDIKLYQYMKTHYFDTANSFG